MVIVKLMGGLGNQMFQYAFGRSLSIRHNTTLKLDCSFLLDRTPRPHTTFRDYDLSILNIKEQFASSEETASFVSYRPSPLQQICKIVRLQFQKRYHIKEIFLKLYGNLNKLDGDIYLDGYWQSESFFKDINSIIRQEFTFKEPMERKANELAQKIISVNAVSINIRRGDYVSDPEMRSLHDVCGGDYYLAAINKMASMTAQPVFFVFSDDGAWCQENLKIKYPFFIVDHTCAGKKFKDYLKLTTLCKHHIIPNSTFAWWGAWLNPSEEKIVIAPKRWFGGRWMFLGRNTVPPEWIKL